MVDTDADFLKEVVDQGRDLVVFDDADATYHGAFRRAVVLDRKMKDALFVPIQEEVNSDSVIMKMLIRQGNLGVKLLEGSFLDNGSMVFRLLLFVARGETGALRGVLAANGVSLCTTGGRLNTYHRWLGLAGRQDVEFYEIFLHGKPINKWRGKSVTPFVPPE